MADYDTTHLLRLLRQHSGIPAVSGYTDAECLRLLTANLHGYLTPMVKAQSQEHGLAAESATYVVALVEGRREYPLPSRATGAAVRKAVLAGPNGARMPLRLLEVDQIEEQNTAGRQLPYGYVVRGGRLYLHPEPANVTGWSLRCALIVRPASLCLLSACAPVSTVVDFNSTEGIYTLSASTFGTADATVRLDLVRASSPFEALGLDAPVALTDMGTTLTVPRAYLPEEGLQVGDYFCPVGQAPFVQAPVELLDLLAVRTAVEQLASLGDASVSQAKAASLQERRHDAAVVITPRTGEARTQGNGFRKWKGSVGSW
jgi:hypothetical protein